MKSLDENRLIELFAAGESRRQIARKLGVSYGAVRAVLNGQNRPHLAERIAAARKARGGPKSSARKKDYDDDLLVRLLAAGQLNYREIAQRVGISAAMVGLVDVGTVRKDLQPRLHDLRRKRLHEARKRGTLMMPGEPLQPGDPLPLPRTRQKSCRYRDEELIELIARPGISHPEIAKQLGISRETVWRVAAGLSRKELQPRIRAAMRAHQTAARHQSLKHLHYLLTLHIRNGIEAPGDLARKCREFVINLAMSDDPQAADDDRCRHCTRGKAMGLAELPEPLMTEVLKALGGPMEDTVE